MNIFKYSAIELNKSFVKGLISAEDIVIAHINKIINEDKYGAFLYIAKEEAIQAAKALDKKRKNGEKLGRLAGVPIAVKDNISVKGMPMTCASHILENYIAPYDATVIEKIKEEDGIIIGKTNMDEFAMGSSGMNSAFKTIKNPLDIAKSPGGSSGGSAVAVAANMVPLSLGSDTGGSVRQPASFCGVIGFKPGYGKISRYGLTAFSSTLDTIGIFARSLSDIKLFYQCLAAEDDKDQTSWKSTKANNYLEFNKDNKKLIYIKEMLEYCSIDMKENFIKYKKALSKKGMDIEEISLPEIKYSLPAYYVISSAEASSNLARFDGVKYGMSLREVKDIDSIYKLTRSKGFGDEVKRRIIIGNYVLSKEGKEGYYEKALAVKNHIKSAFKEILQYNTALISPCTTDIAFNIHDPKKVTDFYGMDQLTVPANLAGLPAISIPIGYIKDMPIGVQIITSQEEILLEFAQAIEESKGVTNYER
ncbi:aspartyl/glutamyl-tRNA(Asn/Gln) amidotransferase subunit A [Clostridium amylolyticum]|uniref:Glutamyl-tRNA(Gln) amidotransferase subunit A n=1 Tax=Clostridium amylolyticum TaxID=1121298 RepID=A0A1M6I5X4_9CLOT|nr:Asp-tRNA(Asn)/Glu-tRNA(Gln) amidotransferase subunit GatA [Clostridium amylolyticum]SHJ29849.1 aspartyl/glutamyl-tRNA(Asn/Gln) amidotransferase subunit A [Clostridium amylolyticum]